MMMFALRMDLRTLGNIVYYVGGGTLPDVPPEPPETVQTYYLLDENNQYILDENGNKIVVTT